MAQRPALITFVRMEAQRQARQIARGSRVAPWTGCASAAAGARMNAVPWLIWMAFADPSLVFTEYAVDIYSRHGRDPRVPMSLWSVFDATNLVEHRPAPRLVAPPQRNQCSSACIYRCLGAIENPGHNRSVEFEAKHLEELAVFLRGPVAHEACLSTLFPENVERSNRFHLGSPIHPLPPMHRVDLIFMRPGVVLLKGRFRDRRSQGAFSPSSCNRNFERIELIAKHAF